MGRQFARMAVVFLIVCLPAAFPAPLRANPALICLLKHVEGFAEGRFLDAVYDSATGAPDVEKIDQRLKQLEESAALRSEMREEIHRLRAKINNRVTREEFRKMITDLKTELTAIQGRLDDLEESAEKHEVEIDDLKHGTKKAGKASTFIWRWFEAVARKKYYKAIANLNIAIRLAPTKDNYSFRAVTYEKMGLPEIAAIDYSEAIRLDPKDPSLYFERGTAYQAARDYRHAIADLTKNLALDPSHTDAYLLRGQAYDALGSYDEAIKDFSRCIRKNPKWVEAYRRRGSASFKKGLYDDALDDFAEIATWLDPKDAEAWFEAGRAGYYSGLFLDDAIQRLTEAIRLRPRWAEAYDVRGRAYFAKAFADYYGDPDGARRSKCIDTAIDDFTEALRLRPGWPDAYVHRAEAECYKGERYQRARAVGDCDDALRRDPKNACALRVRSDAYFGLANYDLGNDNDGAGKEYDRALKGYEATLELEPRHAQAYYGIGEVYHARASDEMLHEHWDKSSAYDKQAVAFYTKAIDCDRKYVAAYIRRAYCYRALGEYARAVADYTKIIQLTNNPNAYWWRGQSYSEMKDSRHALADYEKALSMRPGTPAYQQSVAQEKKRLGQRR